MCRSIYGHASYRSNCRSRSTYALDVRILLNHFEYGSKATGTSYVYVYAIRYMINIYHDNICEILCAFLWILSMRYFDYVFLLWPLALLIFSFEVYFCNQHDVMMFVLHQSVTLSIFWSRVPPSSRWTTASNIHTHLANIETMNERNEKKKSKNKSNNWIT